jgi:hypothetical protein
MRALTLTQPWTGLVASGIKLIENRPRSIVRTADFGEPFALHASREIDESVYGRIGGIAPELRSDMDIANISESLWYPLSRITSSVIGVATIVRSLTPGEVETGAIADPAQVRWFFGPVGYLLRDVRALATPVPCRGWQGFWTLPEDIERAVSEQIPARRLGQGVLALG